MSGTSGFMKPKQVPHILYYHSSGFEDKGIQVPLEDVEVIRQENNLGHALPDYLDPEFRAMADDYVTKYCPVMLPTSNLQEARIVYEQLVRYFEDLIS